MAGGGLRLLELSLRETDEEEKDLDREREREPEAEEDREYEEEPEMEPEGVAGRGLADLAILLFQTQQILRLNLQQKDKE